MRLIGPLPASVSIGAPASTSELHLVGETRRDHCGDPAALAKPDEIHAAAEIVDRDDDLGEIVVDFEILHILGRRFPIGQCDVADAVGEQSLDEALTFVIIGDHSGVTGMRRIDQRRESRPACRNRAASWSADRAAPVRRRELGSQLVVNLDLLLDELEVLRVKLRVPASIIEAAMAIGQNAGTLVSENSE